MSKEALTLALEALESMKEALLEHDMTTTFNEDQAITAIKEALSTKCVAQPEQEPDRFCDANCTWSDHHPDCKYGTQNSDELTIAYMSGLYDGKKQANPEQEPVAFESLLGAIARGWCHEKNANKEMDSDLAIAIAAEVKAIYTTPPQRKPLTDEQIRQVMRSLGWTGEGPSDIEFARAIEAAHGIGDKT